MPMRYYHIFAAIALGFPLSFASDASACSVSDEYRVPTNLELAAQSPLILRARVVGETKGRSAWDSKLVVEPISALKGTLPSGRIAIEGSRLVAVSDRRGFDLLSNPYEFESAHPLSYFGGCIRYMFPLGTTALFFLDWRDGAWQPAGGAFSRWAEDVLEEDAPWVRLTRLYTTVSAAREEDRKGILEAERDQLRSRREDPVAALMASDIDRQLAGPNESWNAMMRRTIDEGASVEAAAEAVAEALMQDEDAELLEEEAVPFEAVDDGLAEAMEDDQPKSGE